MLLTHENDSLLPIPPGNPSSMGQTMNEHGEKKQKEYNVKSAVFIKTPLELMGRNSAVKSRFYSQETEVQQNTEMFGTFALENCTAEMA